MKYSSMVRRSLLTLASASAVLFMGTSSEAFWASFGGGSHGGYARGGSYGSYGAGYASSGSYGSYGSRGSYGGASYASSGSYGGRHAVSYASTGSAGSYGSTGSHGGSYAAHRPGPLQRLVSHIRAKHAARHASYGSTGSYGGYTSSYASSGSHGSTSYGSSGSHGSYSTPVYSEPSHGSAGGHIIHDSCYDMSATSSSAPSYVQHSVAKPVVANAEKASGSLTVRVPADAVVYVNDHKTSSTGTMRNYVSHDLAEGETYQYRVRAEFEQDGEKIVKTKTATITGGGSAELAFAQGNEDAVASQPTETKLTLSVPADAQVTLAGASTTQAGDQREYRTSRLPQGETWDAYTIAVTRDGQTLERTITLVGGESQHLVFDFEQDTAKVAAR